MPGEVDDEEVSTRTLMESQGVFTRLGVHSEKAQGDPEAMGTNPVSMAPAARPSECIANSTTVCSMLVFAYVGISFNSVYLCRILPALGKEARIVPFMVFFNLVWGMSVWSYIAARASDPGAVPRRWYDWVEDVGPELSVSMARLEWQPAKATLCRNCNMPRPERAHHCIVCNVCVLRMDHHCPWIRNCVGFHNYKFFILLVVYSSIMAFSSLALTLPDLLLCAKALLQIERKSFVLPASVPDMVAFLIFGVLALFFLALLTPMLMSHLPLAAQNMTSIESHYDDELPNPFDQGHVLENLSQVFGAFGFDWLLPVPPLRPLSDGVSYDAQSELGDKWVGMYGSEPLWRMRYRVRPASISRTRSGEQRSLFPC